MSLSTACTTRRPCQQAMMETFRTYCEIDAYGRLHIISSTQIVFHTRRIVAHALHIPKSKVRVTKPRIGGGFGAKQTAVSAVYPAFVTWMTKKPVQDHLSAAWRARLRLSPRHEMEMHRPSGRKQGRHRARHRPAHAVQHRRVTASTARQRSVCPVISRFRCMARPEAFRFTRDVVYTNHMSAGAYRGYGATQGSVRGGERGKRAGEHPRHGPGSKSVR